MDKRLIVLDESGEFNTGKSAFIGGVVIDDFDDSVDVHSKMMSELENMYIGIVRSANRFMPMNYELIYPQSIHINSEKVFRKDSGTEIGINQVDRGLKSQVQKALGYLRGELIQKTLSYLENYSYHLYAYIYRGDDVSEKGKTNLTDLDKADNLYERMAVLTLYNQIIFNLNPIADLYYLDLATRSIPVQSAGEETEMAHTKNYNRTFYHITEESFYRVALSTKLSELKYEERFANVSFDLNVQSINYFGQTDTTPIHYMGDIICGYIGDVIHGKLEYDRIEEVHDSLKQPIEIRYYDKADLYYGEMINAVNNHDMKTYFSLRYDFMSESLPGEKYYKEHWISKIDRELNSRIENDAAFCEDIAQSMPEIYEYCDGLMGGITDGFEKGTYIAKKVVKIYRKLLEKNTFRSAAFAGRYYFRFLDILMRGYNHRGYVRDNLKLIKECREYRKYVSMEEYLEHLQGAAEYYFNSMQYRAVEEDYKRKVLPKLNFSKAEESFVEASPLTRFQEAMETLVGSDDEQEIYEISGKVYSTLGRACAFLDSAGAELFFNKALEEFDQDKANREKTIIYLMHYYISSYQKSANEARRAEYRKKYEDCAENLFGTKDSLEQMEKILSVLEKEGDDPYGARFDLYCFLKAEYVFALNLQGEMDFSEDTKSKTELIACMNRVYLFVKKRTLEHMNDHPWELILMNLYKLAFGLTESKKVNIKEEILETILEKAMTIIAKFNDGPKMAAIRMHFLLGIKKNQDVKTLEELHLGTPYEEQVKKDITALTLIPGFEKLQEMTVEELRRLLEKKVTYMYE